MTEYQATQIIELIEEHWKSYLGATSKDMYTGFLLDYEHDVMAKAVALLAAKGIEYPKLSDLREMAAIVEAKPGLPPGRCPTCGGDKMVLVQTRPATQTMWMREHGIEPNPRSGYEEYAPCPDCNATADASFYRYDHSQFVPLDPARVRELIRKERP